MAPNIRVDDNFRHAVGSDYYTKSNSVRRDKETYFRITFDTTGFGAGLDLDFTRWFAKVFEVSIVDRGNIDPTFIPFCVTVSQTALPIEDGHAIFRMIKLSDGTAAAAAADVNETEQRGKTILVCVRGY